MTKKEKPLLSLRIDKAMQDWLAENWETKAEGAEAVLHAFYATHRASLVELTGKLTRGELSIILDVLNGTYLFPQMLGCHVVANVADGIVLNGYNKKWGVDRDFTARLDAMPRAHLVALELWSAWMWRHCQDNDLWEDQITRMAKTE